MQLNRRQVLLGFVVSATTTAIPNIIDLPKESSTEFNIIRYMGVVKINETPPLNPSHGDIYLAINEG